MMFNVLCCRVAELHRVYVKERSHIPVVFDEVHHVLKEVNIIYASHANRCRLIL